MFDRKSKLLATTVVVAAPLALVSLAGHSPRPALAGEQAQPQLYPLWTKVRTKCTGKKKKIRCRLSGELTVVNDGDAPSSPTTVDIWVSKNDVLEISLDKKVKTFDVGAIPAGDELNIPFSFSAPRGTKVVKRYVIAVADPKNVVAELDETDNEEAIGPLQ